MNAPSPTASMQRVAARGLVAVHRGGDRTRLAELYQEGAAQIRLPSGTGEVAEAILINTAGGMTGGDRLSWTARAGAGAGLSLTTQACEKVYRSAGGAARVDVRLEAGPGARLAWLPQETILYDRAVLERRLSVDVAAAATCLLVEAVILGRAAMGETVHGCSFRDSWRVRVAGRLVHAEELCFDGNAASLFARVAVGGGAAAMASILCIGADAPQRLEAVRDVLARSPAVRCGASAWRIGGTGKLLARLLAADGYHLRGALKPLIELLNGEAGLPRIWSL